MELNRQRTVFGLALPPRSAGRKSGSPPSPATTRTPPDPPPPSCSPSGQPLAPQPASGTPQHRRAYRGVRSEPWLQQHPRHRSRSPQLLCSARHTRSNRPPLRARSHLRRRRGPGKRSGRGGRHPGPKAAACARLLVTGMIVRG